MKKELLDIQRILNQPQIAASDIVAVMTKFRVLLEYADAVNRYTTIKLYSDWIAHPRLDRKHAIKILEEINNAFLSPSTTHEGIDRYPPEAVIEAFRFHVLHTEIKTFEKEFGLRIPAIHDWNNWHTFALAIVHELTERPLAFPDTTADNKAGKRLDALLDKFEAKFGVRDALVSARFAISSEGRYKWVLDSHRGDPLVS